MSAVEEREDFARYPPVKSPRLSRWAGLAYGQAQIGENLLLMAQYDKPGAMQRVLAPVQPPPGRRWRAPPRTTLTLYPEKVV